ISVSELLPNEARFEKHSSKFRKLAHFVIVCLIPFKTNSSSSLRLHLYPTPLPTCHHQRQCLFFFPNRRVLLPLHHLNSPKNLQQSNNGISGLQQRKIPSQTNPRSSIKR